MKNIYNKGKYRFHEYGHLRPYLKRRGNKRWRKTTNDLLDELEYEVTGSRLRGMKPARRNRRSQIKVKITESHGNDFIWKGYRWYKSLKALEDSVRRKAILSVSIIYPENVEPTDLIKSKLDKDWTKLI